MERLAFSAVLPLLAVLVVSSAEVPSIDELVEALNTQQEIWIVDRSYDRYSEKGKHSCIFTHIKTPGKNPFQFEQHFKEGNDWTKKDLHGKLSKDGGDTLLTVSRNEEGPGIPYKINYWDLANNCGILTFTNATSEQTECELHARQDSIGKGTSDCEAKFTAICEGRRKERVYSPGDCKRIDRDASHSSLGA